MNFPTAAATADRTRLCRRENPPLQPFVANCDHRGRRGAVTRLVPPFTRDFHFDSRVAVSIHPAPSNLWCGISVRPRVANTCGPSASRLRATKDYVKPRSYRVEPRPSTRDELCSFRPPGKWFVGSWRDAEPCPSPSFLSAQPHSLLPACAHAA
jgi:hypothetical protein